jgi:hypothetical protein
LTLKDYLTNKNGETEDLTRRAPQEGANPDH